MLGLNELDSIPTFVVLEVIFHLMPPILPTGVDCSHLHGTLFAWKCVVIGFESLKAKQLLLHKLEPKE